MATYLLLDLADVERRTAGIRATRPSVDVQSVPSFTADSKRANAAIPFTKEENETQENRKPLLDLVESPCRGAEPYLTL